MEEAGIWPDKVFEDRDGAEIILEAALGDVVRCYLDRSSKKYSYDYVRYCEDLSKKPVVVAGKFREAAAALDTASKS